MRLAEWKGKTKAEWLADTTRRASRWAINREARVSYRDTLAFDEKLLRGEFVGKINPGDSVFISMDEGFAESYYELREMKEKLDELTLQPSTNWTSNVLEYAKKKA